MSDDKRVFQLARQNIAERGWWSNKENPGDGSGEERDIPNRFNETPCCISEAIGLGLRDVFDGDFDYSQVDRLLGRAATVLQIPAEHEPFEAHPVVLWNDAEERTEEEVLALLVELESRS